jgi:hypothetical protein
MNSYVLPLVISVVLSAFPVIIGLAIYSVSSLADALRSAKAPRAVTQANVSHA